MEGFTKEMLDNARIFAEYPVGKFVCHGCVSSTCIVSVLEETKYADCFYCQHSEDSSYFKNFLAKYDLEGQMDTEKEIAELKARIAKLEGKDTHKRNPYPCFKRCGTTGTVVLFTACDTGVCIHPGDSLRCYLGEHSTTWKEENFEILLDKPIITA